MSRMQIIAMSVIALLGVCGTAMATDVTFRLVDETGTLIPETYFRVATSTFPPVGQGGTLNLSQGTHTIIVRPGVAGRQVPGGVLERRYTVAIAGDQYSFQAVWPLASVYVALIDQNDVPIPGSQLSLGFSGLGGFRELTNSLTGSTVRVPITEDTQGPPITGLAANGYGMKLLPGINGLARGGVLERIEPIEELTAAGARREHKWTVMKSPVRIVTCGDVEVAQASLAIPGFTNDRISGTTIVLPVNDRSLYPTLTGIFAAGYRITIRLQPGGVVHGPFHFVLAPPTSVAPKFVLIAEEPYGLRITP